MVPAAELCGKLLQLLCPSHLPSTVEEAVLALEHFFLCFGFRGGWVVAHTSEARAVGFTLVLIYLVVLGGL